uniref:Electron transport protein SCO1/SenC n=1 Tax=Magnetococcus massalia (strain MO-1) TaxID=451514 RepID=A0A1S7LDZ2_MAGMO|nr:Protein of unknown function [Candidatus Magnetococcus massalia]
MMAGADTTSWLQRHWRHGLVTLILLANISWIFIVGLANFQADADGMSWVNRPVDLPRLPQVDDEVALLYLGYVGCGVSCPTALGVMAETRQQFEAAKQPPPALFFINIQAGALDIDLADRAAGYAEGFHDAFVGVEVTPDQLSAIGKQLDVSLSPTAQDPDAFGHTGFIYLLKRSGKEWVHRGTYLAWPPDPDKLYRGAGKLLLAE